MKERGANIMSIKNKIIAICPLLSTVLFLVLGFADDFGLSDKSLWHPGWVVFLLTPLVTAILKMRKIEHFVSFIITIIYIIIGLAFDLWHPGWIIFLLIPILNILLTPPKRTKRVRWSFVNEEKSTEDDKSTKVDFE